jgi:hypothetical protein
MKTNINDVYYLVIKEFLYDDNDIIEYDAYNRIMQLFDCYVRFVLAILHRLECTLNPKAHRFLKYFLTIKINAFLDTL